ncbi:transcriptional repressor LexA [Candidatus Microgenomates bacterium]|nr:transcriptional repressor LexA [Candidatus Microgenomates bacterium]
MPVVLYRKQREILEFISQYNQRYGYAPTLKEIGESTGTSIATIYEHVETLIKKGVLTKKDGLSRSLEIVDDKIPKMASEGVQLPIMGFIAAGAPLEPHTDPDAYLSVSPSLLGGSKPHFVLQVKGTSLIEDGILEGDYVVIEHRDDAKNGDLVVAILESGLATLKKIYFEKDRVCLRPANKDMSPIYATNVRVQGKVVGLIRKYLGS